MLEDGNALRSMIADRRANLGNKLTSQNTSQDGNAQKNVRDWNAKAANLKDNPASGVEEEEEERFRTDGGLLRI